jgi:hypothetical protein
MTMGALLFCRLQMGFDLAAVLGAVRAAGCA